MSYCNFYNDNGDKDSCSKMSWCNFYGVSKNRNGYKILEGKTGRKNINNYLNV